MSREITPDARQSIEAIRLSIHRTPLPESIEEFFSRFEAIITSWPSPEKEIASLQSLLKEFSDHEEILSVRRYVMSRIAMVSLLNATTLEEILAALESYLRTLSVDMSGEYCIMRVAINQASAIGTPQEAALLRTQLLHRMQEAAQLASFYCDELTGPARHESDPIEPADTRTPTALSGGSG